MTVTGRQLQAAGDVVVVSVVMVRVKSGHCGEDGDMTVVQEQIVLRCSDDGVKS